MRTIWTIAVVFFLTVSPELRAISCAGRIFLSASDAGGGGVDPQTEKGWIAKIAENSSSDSLRYRFATWLEARGDVRGTYMRLSLDEFATQVALATDMGDEISVHDRHSAGRTITQDSYFGMTRGVRDLSLIANVEEIIPGFTRLSGVPLVPMPAGRAAALESIRRQLKEIERETIDLWNASEFGKGVNKTIGLGSVWRLQRGMPVFSVRDNSFIELAPQLHRLGVTQIWTNAHGRYYWDKYFASREVVAFLNTLSYFSAGVYGGNSSGMNHDVLARLITCGEFPHLVQMDLMGVHLSWLQKLFLEGANLPRLRTVITGFANVGVGD